MTYDHKRIRHLLNQIATEQELRHFRFEQPDFREVYDELKESDCQITAFEAGQFITEKE